MSPNKGGRPRNAWTSSRMRKLVRLYTLTTLNMHEIVSVLKAHEFDPSSRDVQKKLRELFPRDYTKCHKSFRPPKDRPIQFRLEKLRAQRREGALSDLNQCDEGRSLITNPSGAPNDPETFEGVGTAFRGYSGSGELAAPYTFIQVTVGCGTQSTRTDAQAQQTSTTVAQEDLSSTGSQSRLSLISIKSLKERVKRSSSFIQHVHSVLRFSSTNSWRSSLSFRSSVVSLDYSSWVHSFTEHPIAGPQMSEQQTLASSSSGLREAETERMMAPHCYSTENDKPAWHEELWMDIRNRHVCSEDERLSLRHRPCYCGRQESHLRALHGQDVLDANTRDFFGNTPLHFAAISWNRDCNLFIKIIDNGTDARSVNTSGETFLHTLFHSITIRDLLAWTDLLIYLEKLSFPFSAQDYHGRTVMHVLFDSDYRKLKKLPSKQVHALFEAVKIMKPRLDIMDNLGHTISDYLYDPPPNHMLPGGKAKATSITDINFIGSLSKLQHNLESWTDWLGNTGTYSWLDSDGNTPLHALIKTFPAADNETVLEGIIRKLSRAGTCIHMRDRTGETALAIAVRRGFRPVITTLVDLGASIHCRDYVGTGVLVRARKHLRKALKKEDMKLYSRILSVVTLLVDLGAVKYPIGVEWAVPSSLLARRPRLGHILALNSRGDRIMREAGL
ncbi:ankyrin [Mollisia scopiformis]|uniref:Ankyrin n=1 Tax=Mollisia scopiformis TaxID=149040 RepID=A0A132B8P7_MOLSC|nr:ankyrin [Mollisia scopiformis]KUJ08778.1 ankyrin [Mollisia scopiformis]